MKTKNYEFYFQFWCCWWDWALPLKINIECLTRGYTEIELQVLYFWFCFTRISNEFSNKVDKIIGGKK